jgi:hypothetical protein
MHSIKRNKIDTQSRADAYIYKEKEVTVITKSDYNLKSGCT